MQKSPRNLMADLPNLLHKSVVLACVGLTVVGMVCTGGLEESPRNCLQSSLPLQPDALQEAPFTSLKLCDAR
ncbi:hypothetical protein FHG87_006043 [Trinorchestia longiramus]|nr:hypothetical protein FHG87_006043 [Trinorchestia longiramus]